MAHEEMKESDKPALSVAQPATPQALDPMYNVLPPSARKLHQWAQALPEIEDAEGSQLQRSGEYFACMMSTPQAGNFGQSPSSC
jgi:hypothetical protein